MRSIRVCVVATALAAMTACSSSPGATAPTPTPSASAPVERTFALDGEPMLLCVTETRAVCGRLTVPEDRNDPGGRRIELSVMVIPATDPDPAPDPVFFLAGGPGGAATQSWLNAPFLFPEIHAHRDIVLMDQRGTGHSNLQRWPETPDLTGMSPTQVRAAISRWMDDALAGLDADPRFYASPAAADDLDDVRAALGFDRIDVYGSSYGATLAQYYLRQHEDHVRAVVLDGGTLLDVPIFELLARSSQDALDSVFERCAADPGCSAAYPDPAGDLADATSRLAVHPVETGVRDPWTDEPIVVDADALAGAVHQLLVTSAGAEVPMLVHQAASGEIESIAARIRDASEDPASSSKGMVMYWSIVCSEEWARFDPTSTAELASGSYLAQQELALARQAALACSVMPKASLLPGDGEPVRSNVPVLLLTGAEDPQDPPANVADAPTELPNSLSIVAPGLGHTVGQFGCLPDVVGAFIDAGSVAGLDTSCVAEMTPAPFATP